MFWPDRWLIAEGLQPSQEKITHNPDAFMPFSFGPYSCVGKSIALAKMRQLLCHFMQKLNICFVDGIDPEEFKRVAQDTSVYVVGELPVIVERRD